MELFLGWLILSVGVGCLANARGRSGFGFFLVSALLSPLIGLIIVLVVRNPKEEEQQQNVRRQEHERQLESIRAIATPRSPDLVVRAPPTVPTMSVADEIQKLATLRDRRLLTDSEFQVQKSRLLGSSEPATTVGQPVASVLHLKELEGTCPNCDASIPCNSPTCPDCKADFGPGSALFVKPLQPAQQV